MFFGLPYYSGDLKGDPNLENYPIGDGSSGFEVSQCHGETHPS